MNAHDCIYGIVRVQLEHSGGPLKGASEIIGRHIKIRLFALFLHIQCGIQD